MKKPFKYQLEFTGISISAVCSIGAVVAFKEWGWLWIVLEAIVFDVATSAFSQWLRWRMMK